MSTKVKVSELFYSFQGEGSTVGVPAVFLRLSGCVLNCKWCDTVEVWKQGTEYDPMELIGLFRGELLKSLNNGAHLILTGGDPLIQQYKVLPVLKCLAGAIPDLHIEVETEGVLMPGEAFSRHIWQWNVSPKLSNSGMPNYKRTNLSVLSYHAKQTNSIFKFPVANEADLKETVTLVTMAHIPSRRVWLMPICSTRKEFEDRSPEVAKMAQQMQYNFSPRLHLTVYDRKTGV